MNFLMVYYIITDGNMQFPDNKKNQSFFRKVCQVAEIYSWRVSRCSLFLRCRF